MADVYHCFECAKKNGSDCWQLRRTRRKPAACTAELADAEEDEDEDEEDETFGLSETSELRRSCHLQGGGTNVVSYT